MERAGLAAAEEARAMLDGRGGRVVVLAGPGNNGGDAFVVARWLRSWFYDVVTVFRADPARFQRDAANAYAAFLAQGEVTAREIPAGEPSLVIDGLFGIGLARPAAADYAELIEWANACGAPILALDIPSGVDADTGAVFAPAIHARLTLTFLAWKPGLLTGDGVDRCGSVVIHPLGVVDSPMRDGSGHRLDWPSLSRSLPDVLRRARRNVHKGSFGTLGVLGGATGMVGAPLLAGRAALKLGSGKVWIGFAASGFPTVDMLAPELMLRSASDVPADGPDAIVVGPGLGSGDDARSLVERAIGCAGSLVLDADALNLIARDSDLRSKLRARLAPTLATPHPAEAARLLDTDTGSIAADRLAAATAIARELNAHVVLKGAGSVLAAPNGEFDINASGGPALATAGSGDVLAGMLGALLAQGIDPRSALRYAVCLHGAAADALVDRGVGPLGLVASELADAARGLVNVAARDGI